MQTCHKCQQPFTDNDIVVLNAQDEDLKEMEENLIARKAQKKSKKRANGAASSTVTSNGANGIDVEVKQEKEETESTSNEVGVPTKKTKVDGVDGASTSNGDDAVTKKIKKPKDEKSAIGRSKIKRPEDPAYKKTKQDYHVSDDPKSTEVYKSLFTSHKTAAEQERAHWVTYNPFYN